MVFFVFRPAFAGLATAAAAGDRAGSALAEEREFFMGSSSLFDSKEYRNFLQSAAHSANSQKDHEAHNSLTRRVRMDRGLDIPLQDYFAQKEKESSQAPSLRSLASEQWAGLEPARR